MHDINSDENVALQTERGVAQLHPRVLRICVLRRDGLDAQFMQNDH